ncbi:hypothetical protein PFFCH_03153 [Plasmodium falciparum FCH/4]|nr:hypothetical protein PFFCH_03153 [Plasmodium falciparum FCH/4]
MALLYLIFSSTS